jgi:hypothetical protein
MRTARPRRPASGSFPRPSRGPSPGLKREKAHDRFTRAHEIAEETGEDVLAILDRLREEDMREATEEEQPGQTSDRTEPEP